MALELLQEWGYLGLFIGAFVAATVLPFSSDLMLVGLLAAGADPYISILSATAGNWLGGLTSYWVGHLGRWEWIERFLHIKREKLEAQQSAIARWGSLLALMTWVPFIGDVMAVALGFYRINIYKSALFMLIGKAARFIAWALIYYYFR
ncbi:MAG: YqaA family protein [Rikenellaceae bacterium]